jgi:hypothetical protein
VCAAFKQALSNSRFSCPSHRYKEPFYKGGKIKERTPGYCDRVLYHSLVDDEGELEPEKVQLPASLQARGGEGQGLVDNYRPINDGAVYSISDHSPVYATFELKLKRPHAKYCYRPASVPPPQPRKQTRRGAPFEMHSSTSHLLHPQLPPRVRRRVRSRVGLRRRRRKAWRRSHRLLQAKTPTPG